MMNVLEKFNCWYFNTTLVANKKSTDLFVDKNSPKSWYERLGYETLAKRRRN